MMITQGHLILKQAIELRERVRSDLDKQQFGADDVNMKAYNDLTQCAANLFPFDPVLNGGMVIMPDAVLQSFGTLSWTLSITPHNTACR
jgi:hypothetical protein